MGSVFGMHDRENVEVFCYALSANDGSEWRLRIQSEVEHFIDVSSMSSDMIAKMINEDKYRSLSILMVILRGQEMKYLPCSRPLYRFLTWDFLELQAQTIYIT
ncbi:probable UDP-N-acetylglucosamine--peptide N-acetylglucosaminyltransferase SEC [Humulus lupulus]|uniref:probable UDP-N-acetylglucosamine--peptide N-acetylglucosaminyltransferase SEC n=1 Tax=Humulus lupulus TaxID=3486 RepID=UPI002B40A4A2|nr:probable UDP-N-acetylglucosamine--peptide N-acetylglucosaminyltransferase SEC [Humulus lupulus]